jgi:uncharacterized protein YndB with AHSA1/START domain
MNTGITAKTQIEINAPVEKVWEGLTNPELIKQYFFGTNARTNWKPGSPIVFEGEYNGMKYQDKGTIKQFEINKLIQYDYWSSMGKLEDKPENYLLITYQLESKGATTLLTVTQENVPSEDQKEHSEKNWMVVLEGLKKLVEQNI